MTSRVRCACAVALTMLAMPAFAQNADRADDDTRPKRATEVPTEGFWPTRKMMDRFIDRITGDLSERYDFDDEQLELTRDMFKAQFPKFLNENRAEIQTLMNQYLEAILDEEPPAVVDVAEWAQRVQPLLAEFGEVVTEVTEGMREYLTDEQLTTLDAETAAFQTGMTMVQNKLSVWADGGYDPETEWMHQGGDREHEERERRRAETSGEDSTDPERTETSATKGPKDAWAIYTERFIERYKLDGEQRQKAFTLLRRQQERRDNYLRRKGDEMARVTERLEKVETDEERAAALEAYARLNKPIERLFEQLKVRLDTLPTRAQRRAAAEAGLETDDERKPTTNPNALTDEDRERLESTGYLKPSSTQPSQPAP